MRRTRTMYLSSRRRSMTGHSRLRTARAAVREPPRQMRRLATPCHSASRRSQHVPESEHTRFQVRQRHLGQSMWVSDPATGGGRRDRRCQQLWLFTAQRGHSNRGSAPAGDPPQAGRRPAQPPCSPQPPPVGGDGSSERQAAAWAVNGCACAPCLKQAARRAAVLLTCPRAWTGALSACHMA